MHKALLLLRKIPKGKVTTYKALAGMCNTSPRAIGSIMKHNKFPDTCPCYKVIKANGELGGYSGAGGLKAKMKLLAKDGIVIEDGKVSRRYVWLPRHSHD